MADDLYTNDRRRVVNAGELRGRAVHVTNMRAVAEVGFEGLMSTVIATRGQNLTLIRIRSSVRGSAPGEVTAEMLSIIEIDTDNRLTAAVIFDPADIDAALEELDARYLAGEAAAHAHTWSVITKSYAATNRHELPPTTPDWENVDHRRAIGFAPGNLEAYLRATFDNLVPDIHVYIEVVHRLSNIGAVVTRFGRGTSREGFEAEWREIGLSTIRGDLINRSELFDEADLDAALARFDELHLPTRRLENAAIRADDRFFAYFRARNWAALAAILADDVFIDDRRPVVNAGLWDGRDVVIANMQALAEAAADVTSVIATRGERLALSRIRSPNRDPGQGEFGVEMLNIVEIDTDERILSHVHYDKDDSDAAFAELDARYLAGEAAPYANTWSAIAGAYMAFNRHEIPATPDWANVDHRRATTVAPGDMAANIRATWDVAPNISRSIEAVHRLDNLGAVVTHTAYGTSREGSDAEWRLVALLTFTGDLISRAELFDEADLGAALARFDELDRNAEKAR
jgi:hypothetical protein